MQVAQSCVSKLSAAQLEFENRPQISPPRKNANLIEQKMQELDTSIPKELGHRHAHTTHQTISKIPHLVELVKELDKLTISNLVHALQKRRSLTAALSPLFQSGPTFHVASMSFACILD